MQDVRISNGYVHSITGELGALPKESLRSDASIEKMLTSLLPQFLKIVEQPQSILPQLEFSRVAPLTNGNTLYQYTQSKQTIPFPEARLQVIVAPDGEVVSV